MFPYIIATVLPSGDTIAIPQSHAVIYPDPTAHRDQARQDLVGMQKNSSSDPSVIIPDFIDIPEDMKGQMIDAIKATIGKQHGDRVDQLVALTLVELVVDYMGSVFWLRNVRWDCTLDDVLEIRAGSV